MRAEELNELYWLNKEVEDLESRIKELTFLSASVLSDEPHAKGNKNEPTQKLAFQIIKLKNRLHETQLLILEEKEKLERFIETVPDSKMRSILRLRCIDLKSYKEIGSILKLDRKTVSTKYNDFLNDLKRKVEENVKKNEKTN